MIGGESRLLTHGIWVISPDLALRRSPRLVYPPGIRTRGLVILQLLALRACLAA